MTETKPCRRRLVQGFAPPVLAAACFAVGPNFSWSSEPLHAPVAVDRALSNVPVKRLQVWVELTLPTIAATGAAAAGSRAAQVRAIGLQQDDVAMRLRDLGATELGRVRLVRNAVAIDVDATQLDRIRALPGVRAVTPIRHAEVDVSTDPVR